MTKIHKSGGVNLLHDVELACGDTGVEVCQGWIQHTAGFLPRCLVRESVACDVDKFSGRTRHKEVTLNENRSLTHCNVLFIYNDIFFVIYCL